MSRTGARAPGRRAKARRLLVLCVCCVCASVRLSFAQCPDGTPPPCAAQRPAPAPNSIAVLAFENAARDTSLDWLGDGLGEEVATQLAAAPGLTVRGTGIVRNAWRVAAGDLRRLGQLVSVRYVVEGSYRRMGARVRVAARLLALPAGDARWGHIYDRARDSLSTLSDAIAQDLAAALVPSTAAALARRGQRRLPDPLAYESYQKGRFFFLRDDPQTARSLFEQAIARDSAFGPAWAGLANALAELADGWIAPLDALPRARDAARRALALDSTLASAYVPLAWVAGSLDRDCRTGERLLDRAIAKDSALPEAWAVRGAMLVCQRRGSEALMAARHAWELDSLSSYAGGYLLEVAYNVEPPELPALFALVRQRLSAYWAQYWGAIAALGSGDCATAERLAGPLAGTNRGDVYVRALACLGRRAEADSVVRAQIADTARRYVNPVDVAMGLLALGDNDGAIRWLERGADERTWWVTHLPTRPEYAPLRGDPRFEALVRRLGLQP
jgi:TolB-like protein